MNFMKFKKSIVLSLTGIFTVSFLISCAYVFAYPRPVAVIMNYDDIEENITIIRSNGEPDGAEAFLYPEDRITGSIDLIEAECSPYTELKIDERTYIVSYTPPSGVWGVSQAMSDKAASFWSNAEDVAIGASRGLDLELNLTPQPGFDVTLLMNYKVSFSWDDFAYKKFFIKDDKGKVIFVKDTAGINSIDIVPASLQLKEKVKYTWGLEGTASEYKFTVLDSRTEKELLLKLKEIDQENMSAEERVLKKIKYVQLISDMYSDIVDLYWLGLQWLSDIAESESHYKDKQILLKKTVKHLDEEI